MELFYDKYVHKLLQVIMNDKAINSEGTRVAPASILGLIVDLFCFFVQHHSYRVKYYVLRSHMIERVLRVVRRRERWLACAGVRFLRTCITIKDEFFTRYMVGHARRQAATQSHDSLSPPSAVWLSLCNTLLLFGV